MSANRRDFLKLASLFALSGSFPLLQACQKNFAKQPNAPLRIGYLPITDATPLLVAIDQQLFTKRGIEVEKPVLFRSWAQLVEAFISGQVNVIHLLSPMAIWLRYGSSSPAKIVMWNHMAGSALTVAHKVNTITDLGGQTVAIPFWYSIHNVVLQHLLRENGLSITEKMPKNRSEVRLVVMAPSDMVAALAAERISGFIVAEPFNALAETKGIGKILRFSADIWKDHACCVTLMHDHDLENRPEWSEKVVDALVEAQIWSNNHRDETALLLSNQGRHQLTPHHPEILRHVLAPSSQDWQHYIDIGIIKHPQWHQERIAFQPYPFPSYLETLLSMLQKTHIAGVNQFLYQLKPQQVIEDLMAPKFVKSALENQDAFTKFNLPRSLIRKEVIAV